MHVLVHKFTCRTRDNDFVQLHTYMAIYILQGAEDTCSQEGVHLNPTHLGTSLHLYANPLKPPIVERLKRSTHFIREGHSFILSPQLHL